MLCILTHALYRDVYDHDDVASALLRMMMLHSGVYIFDIASEIENITFYQAYSSFIRINVRVFDTKLSALTLKC